MLANMLLATSRNIKRMAYLGSTTGAGSSVTWSSVNLGTIASDRVIVVAVVGASAGSRQVSGVTIGGVSATLAARSATFTIATGVYYLTVSAGATANIVASFTWSMDDILVAAYSLTEWGAVSVFDSDVNNSTVTTLTATDFDTSAGGLQITASGSAVAGGTTSALGFGSVDALSDGTAGNLRIVSHWATPDKTDAAAGITSDLSSDKAITAIAFS
ncbi:MAG: hypothetical protein KAY91_04935 [Rhodocyclaceae bacterium]|nr:hypothetical protein [Rhodocyclaceae bacterium]